jgi:polyisoprenoid-binding protein YceI
MLALRRATTVARIDRHRRILLVALTAFCWSLASLPALAANRWRIDETHTAIGFTINAVGFPTTHGHFNHFSGRIALDFQQPAKSFTSFVVDATSVELGSKSFDDFVKSPALLNTGKYPTLRFASTAVEKVDAHTARMTGNLTMLGVTKPITLTVHVDTEAPAGGRVVAFSAKGNISCSAYGMIFGVPIIDDTLEFTVKTRALTDE